MMKRGHMERWAGLRPVALAIAFIVTVMVWLPAQGRPTASPFTLNGTTAVSNEVAWVTFDFRVPPDHVLYAERLAFEKADSQPLRPVEIAEPVMHLDAVSGQQKLVYDQPFSATLKVFGPFPQTLVVKFQGCSNSACYFPERHEFTVTESGLLPVLPKDDSESMVSSGASEVATNGFRVAGSQTGYVPKATFLAFLERGKRGEAPVADGLDKFNKVGPVLSLFFILLGGAGLNLTPCVLPLIPINLAIIGAGARASSRRRGFALGGMYGLGMALVYGLLGLFVVLTGAKFGTLNSSAWFNTAIAAVFVVMALAMFDLLNVDFSRFQVRLGGSSASQGGKYVLALSMGAMAALLAGACVAPVVISVLLMAAQLYGKGVTAGLLLPFVLGLGMAIPWPFAGAGLSFLPKPGGWMKWVKYSFAVLILLFAGYYGHLAINGFRFRATVSTARNGSVRPDSSSESSNVILTEGLRQAKAQGKPLLIDFAASWCKNCLAMDSTVFTAPEVKQQLNQFVVVRYAAERPNESPAREVLNQFGVMGLPTYAVLLPDK